MPPSAATARAGSHASASPRYERCCRAAMPASRPLRQQQQQCIAPLRLLPARLSPHARRPGGGSGWDDEEDYGDDAEEDAEWDGDGFFGGVDPSSVSSRLTSLLTRLLDTLSDAAYAATPDGVSRSTVDTGIRVGAAFILLSALKAAVGFVFALVAGGVGLALASRLLSSEAGAGSRERRRRGGRAGKRRDGKDDDFWGGVRRAAGRGLPSGLAAPGPPPGDSEEGDLLDVWFERGSAVRAGPARRLPGGGVGGPPPPPGPEEMEGVRRRGPER